MQEQKETQIDNYTKEEISIEIRKIQGFISEIQTSIRDIRSFIDKKQTDIRGIQDFIDVVAVAPTHIPSNFWDQIKYCTADSKLYIYDFKNNSWKSSAAFS